jgi:hypothetical protein
VFNNNTSNRIKYGRQSWADMDDGVFEAPSPIEMEVYEDGAHAENLAQGDVDSRNAQQTPPHGHDSEQSILDRSKNICFLY